MTQAIPAPANPAQTILAEASRCLGTGELERAKTLARGVLAGASGHPEALFVLGSALALSGAPAEAVPLFRRSIASGGATAERLHNLGLALHQTGELEEAERSFVAAILRAPTFADGYHGLGVTLAARGNNEDAAAALRRAVEERPDWTEAHLNLARVLGAIHQPQAAFEVYRDLLARHPRKDNILFLAGTAALNADRLEEAEGLLRRALLRSPRDAGAMNNLGHALIRMGRVGEAVHILRQAVAVEPGHSGARFSLAAALDAQGDSDEAAETYRAVAEMTPGDHALASNQLMMLNYRDTLTADGLAAAHRSWGDRLAEELAPALAAEPRPALRPLDGRRLRIGYVSPDFRLHAVAMFLLPLLESHDRARVELFAYSNVEMPDVITNHVRCSVDGWRVIRGMTDEAVAAQVRADGIDVLVDLAGHTAGNRLGVFARQPAPVQVSWLGYPATTGLAVIDARFTDAVADPPGESDRQHAERLVRLDGGFLCYRPLGPTPDPAPPPCLAAGTVTFGSFNILNKLNPSVVALWARVLHAVPGSRLLLKAGPLIDTGVRKRVLARFASCGIAAGRIDLMGRVPDNDGHLNAYGRMDIALDPFPYNGTTTSCEALWMGVPVLTLPVDRHAARVGASLLTAIGRPDLIAADEEDFIRKAVALAADPGRLADDRRALRGRIQASRLWDAASFGREFERRCFALAVGAIAYEQR